MSEKINDPKFLLMRHMASLLSSRARLGQKIGESYDGDRDLYEALGYKTSLVFNDYWNMYIRGGIAKRIVEAKAKATWRGRPELIDPNSKDTRDSESPLMSKWSRLVKKLNLWHYFERVDKLAGIGRFGGLLIGFNDGRTLDQPVGKQANDVMYLSAYSEGDMSIGDIDGDVKSPRYGMPEYYSVAMPISPKSGNSQHHNVHWTRVIHVADGLMTDEVYGTPRLEAVYNHVEDMLKVVGSSGEMFYRGAFPGYTFNMDSDAELDAATLSTIEDEIEEYVHQMKRYMRLQGIDVKAIEQQVASPREYVETLLTLIAGTTEIPQRILVGSEEGKLASGQDQANWNSRVDERRRDFAEPVILRPFIDRMMKHSILPNIDDYAIIWPDIEAMDEGTKSEIAMKRAEALFRYTTSPGAMMVVPPHRFRRDFLGYSEEESNRIENEVGKIDVSEFMGGMDDEPDDTDDIEDDTEDVDGE